MSDLILPFERIDHRDIARVGGKGANLGEMTKAGFPVPPGFCVTTEAFRLFIAPVSTKVIARLDGLDPGDLEALRAAGEEVRGLLETCQLPDAIINAVRQTWQSATPETKYAVRSSATAEDLPTASFAGQQDTYLNVQGEKSLLERIHACFISLYTDRAILYRIQNGFAHHAVALSVVVQEMVFPEVSGIMFTADPMSGHRDIISVDASFGLGEALVSGTVNADLYKVNKINGAILSKNIAAKDIEIRPLAEGGTEVVQVPVNDRNSPALSDANIKKLALLGRQIENHYGSPQDIEWALVGEKLYITQSRPITSLYPLPQIADSDEDPKVFLSLSHLQVMTDPMPPMAISVWRHLLPICQDETGQFAYIQSIGGRMYANISPMLRHPLSRYALNAILSVADQIAQGAVTEVAARSKFRNGQDHFHPFRYLWKVRRYVTKVPTTFIFGPPTGLLSEVNHRIAHYRKSDEDSASTPLEHLDATIASFREVLPIAGTWIPYLAAGILSQRLLRKFVPESAYPLLDEFERGIEGNIVTEMNLTLGDIADIVTENSDVKEALKHAAKGSVDFTGLEKTGFLKALDQFLDFYGDRAGSEIDISKPRWREEPEVLFQMILGLAHNKVTGSHQIHFAQLTEASHKAEKELPGHVGWLKRPIVRRLITNARALIPLREYHKFLMLIGLSRLKEAVIECAEVLVTEQQLKVVEDVWFLELPELRTFLVNKDVPDGLIAQRRSSLLINGARTPPRVMTERGEIPNPELIIKDAPEGALIGSPVSSGLYEGRAHVVTDPSKEILQSGDILVAPFTDPGWTPLFVNAGALVTEVGGLMTHGSVVAREYGIPAVVGVVDATKAIKTGDTLRVDGQRGIVEILDKGIS